MELLIFAGLLLTAAGVAYGAWRLKAAESIERKKTLAAEEVRAIASLGDGEVAKIVGRLFPGADQPSLEAPLSGEPALHYRVRIEERISEGDRRYWTSFAEHEDCAEEVWLQDEHGDRILLDLAKADVELVMDTHIRTGLLGRSTERVDNFLARCGATREGLIFDKTLRYEEGCLAEGAELRWPGEITIGTRVSKLGKSSVTLEQGLFQDDRCAAVATTVIVQMDETTRRSTPLGERARTRLGGLL